MVDLPLGGQLGNKQYEILEINALLWHVVMPQCLWFILFYILMDYPKETVV